MKEERVMTLRDFSQSPQCNVDFNDECTVIPCCFGGWNNSHDASYDTAKNVLDQYGDTKIYPIDIHDPYYEGVLDTIENSSIMEEIHADIDSFTWYASSKLDNDPTIVFGLW